MGAAFLLLLSVSAWSAETLTIWKESNPISIKTVEVNGFQVDEKCAAKKKTCQALSAHKREPQKPAEDDATGLTGHPASDHCERIGGRVQILTDSKLNQLNFCRLQDDTLVDSWHLFSAYQKRIKERSK